MAFVMPEIALQRLIQTGLKNLRANRPAFDCIFAQYTCPELEASYGQAHIDKIYSWFTNTQIPTLQAWTFDPTRVPAYSIHLADESEDIYGIGEDAEIKTGVSTVSLDIGIHADKSKDHVLWLYYILTYILYKEKLVGRGLGLQLYTFRANDYNKESKYMADNVWSRWVRFRCTVENYLDGDETIEVDGLAMDLGADTPEGSVDPESSEETDISNIEPDDGDCILDPNRYMNP
jgi:hypothetical protein